MLESLKLFKRWDFIIIFVLILMAFLPLAIFSKIQSEKTGNNAMQIAVISVDNKILKEVTLTGHTGVQTFDIYASDNDRNTIEVRDEHILIKSATCNDQVCVRTPAISKPGQTIICLPHKLVIEVISMDEVPSDNSIISS
ncbi:NusG domain II-containing protein [Lederbergia graminis]|uniref:NusG domain II-containing protein n=1 Tax=Lederbergia graminis TaxID=735518 RepID=A0ABW0LC89_9BACI